MKNEAEFKLSFKKSIRAQGGFCLSLAAPMVAGIPDLYVVLNGFMPILLEAKWIKELNTIKKIPYRPMQLHWMKECNLIQNKSAMGLIGFKYQKVIYAALVNHEITHITDQFDFACTPYNRGFDAHALFKYANVREMNAPPILTEYKEINLPHLKIPLE